MTNAYLLSHCRECDRDPVRGTCDLSKLPEIFDDMCARHRGPARSQDRIARASLAGVMASRLLKHISTVPLHDDLKDGSYLHIVRKD